MVLPRFPVRSSEGKDVKIRKRAELSVYDVTRAESQRSGECVSGRERREVSAGGGYPATTILTEEERDEDTWQWISCASDVE